MATQVQIKSGKWIVGGGFIIYSIIGDIETRWKCESCKAEFKTKEECTKHEKKCK